jgi:hypothetical protein
LFLPDNEIKVRESEHDDPEEGGQGAVQYRREHVLQRQHHATLSTADAREESLKMILNDFKMF